MSAPFTEVEMMILSQLAYKEPPAQTYNNGNAKVTLAKYIENNLGYLEEKLGEDAIKSIDSLYAKVSKNPSDYAIKLSVTDKYKTGFSAFAVEGPEEGIVTVAARGTEFNKFKNGDPLSAVKDLETDLQLGLSAEADQQEAMNDFMSQLGECDDIYLTGHSLGGNLAVSGAVCYDDPDKIKGVYTYNAPGHNTAYKTTHAEGICAVEDKITNFQNENDFVSDINKPIGETVVLDADDGSSHLQDGFKIENGKLKRDEDNKKDLSHRIFSDIISMLTSTLSMSYLINCITLIHNYDMYDLIDVVNKLYDKYKDTSDKVSEWIYDTYNDAKNRLSDWYNEVTGKNHSSGYDGGNSYDNNTIMLEIAEAKQVKGQLEKMRKEVELARNKVESAISGLDFEIASKRRILSRLNKVSSTLYNQCELSEQYISYFTNVTDSIVEADAKFGHESKSIVDKIKTFIEDSTKSIKEYLLKNKINKYSELAGLFITQPVLRYTRLREIIESVANWKGSYIIK